ncbi:Cytochrome c oxidase assembly COX19 [Quillaja saponaria]|uniref:Cytochrome c oxidase assembly COX19 n=1 Tax=Quillaja saponaria TaxID=32244 RepID=A0AAD7LRU9_QUISA|nr:Cytochrome c oxidase assembly COX19 [Quillaja saponaria]
MSAGGAFGGNRGLRPVPPEKGVFPLDHMHLCDLEKKDYLSCLKSSGHHSEKCRQFSKKYLECRMNNFNFVASSTLNGILLNLACMPGNTYSRVNVIDVD